MYELKKRQENNSIQFVNPLSIDYVLAAILDFVLTFSGDNN